MRRARPAVEGSIQCPGSRTHAHGIESERRARPRSCHVHMRFERRTFLGMTLVLPFARRGLAVVAAQSDWRTFDVRVDVQVTGARGPVRVWLPLPLRRETPYQRDLGSTWESSGATVKVVESDAAAMLMADWTAATEDPSLALVMRVATRDVSVPLDRPRLMPAENLSRYLGPTALIPIDGIVRDTAAGITRGHRSDLSRARAITTGLWSTRCVIRRCAAAAWVTSGGCSRRRTWRASARISTRSSSVWRVRQACRRGISMGSGSDPRRASAVSAAAGR
jgi:hypothetical protein